MLIEFGALIGALLAGHVVALSPSGNDVGQQMFLVTLLGALWGAAIGAIIHFTSNGALWGWVLWLFGFAVNLFAR